MSDGYRVLSLFDGMGCAHLAMQGAGLPIGRYVAFEVDRFCNEAVAHNFPDAERRGDVFDADFTEFEGFDFLMGGSPCTYWSVAQSADRREVTASGVGWELFQQYVRALHEAKPRWFIYENNKSMSRAIRDSISEAFGFEPVWINSALVSAQKRDRLYWVGRREPDGTYSKVPVEQPADRGILLRDILGTGETWQDKSYACTTRVAGATVKDTLERHRHTMVAEPVGTTEDGKAYTVLSTYDHKGNSPDRTLDRHKDTMVAEPVGATKDDKSFALPATYYKGSSPEQTLTKSRRTLVAEPLRYPEATKKGYAEIQVGECFDATQPSGSTRRGKRMADKSNALTGRNGFHEYMGTVGPPIYEVRDGEIEIRGRRYPIKLLDGRYVIRKLTVLECMRLQTVPEWYDFSCVSNTQAYKMLGNGWTVEVIVHLLRSIMEGEGDAGSGD